MIGVSAAMHGVFGLLANAPQSDAPVIILGNSGTGKELMARAIHVSETRRKQPYLKGRHHKRH
jgi:DNA-binding NtrC family response regulator